MPDASASAALPRNTKGIVPEHFARVLLIVDFPGGAWTPPHTPGGYVYVSVIDGEISTRIFGKPEHEGIYPAGSAFTVTPGEYLELGNATAANSHVFATALLPKGAPSTIDTDGFGSDVYSGPTDSYRVLDSERRAPAGAPRARLRSWRLDATTSARRTRTGDADGR